MNDDLFPPLWTSDNVSSSESISATPSVLEKMLQEEPEFVNQELNVFTDRHFFTDLYNTFSSSQIDTQGNESDFEAYNRQLETELTLRGKMKEHIRTKQHLHGIPLRHTVGDDQLDNFVSLDIPSGPVKRTRLLRSQNYVAKNGSETVIRDSCSVRTNAIDNINFVAFDQVPEKSKKLPSQIYGNVIQRKLSVRHLNSIAFGATWGVGAFLNSGRAFSVAGPLGCLLGMIIAGIVVICTMVSFAEMVTFLPVTDGISGLTSRFLDDAAGFALGSTYYFSFALGLPAEIIASVICLDYFSGLCDTRGSRAGWISLFYLFAVVSNMFDVRIFGEVEFLGNVIKTAFLFSIIIIMVVINRGGLDSSFIGFRFWDSSKSISSLEFFTGPFRPTFDLSGGQAVDGISGPTGHFLSVIAATLICCYAYISIEAPCIAAGEAVNPRRALPQATKKAVWKIFIFYTVSTFCVGLNIYSGDPRLARYFDASGESQFSQAIIEAMDGAICSKYPRMRLEERNQSPWVLAVESAGCTLPSVLNAFIVFFAVTSSSSHLYVASRSLYALSIQGKAPKIFSRCTKRGIPHFSVGISSCIGLLAFLGIDDRAAKVFQHMVSLISSSGIIAWSGISLSYIRFHYGLQLRPDIIARSEEAYPFKVPLQPYIAIVGFTGSLLFVLLMGFGVFITGFWDTLTFFTSYGGVILFVLLFIGYKVLKTTKIQPLDQLDLDTGRREVDSIVWAEKREFRFRRGELLSRLLEFF